MQCGIDFPFYFCIMFGFIAMLVVIFTWTENDVEKLRQEEKEALLYLF